MASYPGPVYPCGAQCQRRNCGRGLFPAVHEGRWYYCRHNAAGAGFPHGEVWRAKCIPYCASPYRRSPVAGYEMAWCLLCWYGPAFWCQVSSIYLHMYSRLSGVGGQAKLHVTFPMHYLVDFHTLGPPGSSVCQHNLDRSIDCFSKLGIPLHPDKLEGPLTCLTILGIELDSLNLLARLPQDKFDRITALLEDWSQKRWCKRKDLESLIGHLQHACKVVPQGRSFLRRMINLLCAFRRDDHPIRLNQEFFLDLAWWQEFFQSWNGCSFLQYPLWAPIPDFEVSSDASGALGYGAVFQGHWFSGAWLPSQVSQSIEYKELFPIVVAAYLWGPQWASKRVNFLSDNRSVVDILRSGTSRAPTIMSLVRFLSLLAARHSFSFTASPVRGKSNPIADSLSRFQFQRFRQLAPLADSIPTQIPQQLLSDLDLRCQINTTSIWLRVLPPPLGKSMLLPNAASWFSVLRTIAYLLRDQLFQPVKTCSSVSAVILLILFTIHP